MNEDICENCAYYKQYYIICNSRQFSKANRGACRLKLRKSTKPADSCEHFLMRDTEAEKESQNRSFRDIIISIHKQLEKILEILICEEN